MQVDVVVGREHGHGEKLQARARLALERGAHRLRIGVYREERDAELGDAFDPLRDRIGDVVQLHVEEDLFAGLNQRAPPRPGAGKPELIADLVEADRVTEPLDHRLRGFDRRQIEGDDEAFARARFHCVLPHATCRATSTRRRATVRSSAALRSSLSSSFSSKAWLASRTAICSGITSAPQPNSSDWRNAMSERMPPRVPFEAAPSANTRLR